MSVARRAEQVAQLLTLLGDISPAVIPDTLLPQVSVMIDEALAGQSQPTILAGPTGETNQLILEPVDCCCVCSIAKKIARIACVS